MGKIFIKHYDSSNAKVFICNKCETHLALASEIISKNFHGVSGTAYLFENCINVTKQNAERRELSTGFHTVANINCISCNTYLGWYYHDAENPSQEYKIDKYILECSYIKKIGDNSQNSTSGSNSRVTESASNVMSVNPRGRRIFVAR